MSRIAATFGLAALLLSSSPALAAGYLIKQGKGYAVCEAIKKELDKLGPLKEPLRCPQRVTKSIPGLTEAAWEDLDVEEHWDFFVKLNAHSMAPGVRITKQYFDALMTDWRMEAKRGLVKLQVLRANIVLIDGEQETVARVWRRNGCFEEDDWGSINLVTPDLSGVDNEKLKKTFGFEGADLYAYRGKNIAILWGNSAVTVAADFGMSLVTFCTIDFDWSTRNKELGK